MGNEFLIQAAAFFGWCSVINIGIYTVAAIALLVFSKGVKKIHTKVTDLSEDQLSVLYFQYLANYKLAIFLFNLVPYIALRIMLSA